MPCEGLEIAVSVQDRRVHAYCDRRYQAVHEIANGLAPSPATAIKLSGLFIVRLKSRYYNRLIQDVMEGHEMSLVAPTGQHLQTHGVAYDGIIPSLQ